MDAKMQPEKYFVPQIKCHNYRLVANNLTRFEAHA